MQIVSFCSSSARMSFEFSKEKTPTKTEQFSQKVINRNLPTNSLTSLTLKSGSGILQDRIPIVIYTLKEVSFVLTWKKLQACIKQKIKVSFKNQSDLL